MSEDKNDPHLGRFEYGLVRRKARQMIGRAGFKAQDCGELEQELFARLLHSLKSFDPTQSHQSAFVTAVVERDVANILRDKQAAKRDHRRISSLNVMISVTHERTTELAQTIGQRELDARRGRHPRNPEELAQLMFDMHDIINKLPKELRVVAQRLMTETISEMARATGVPRTSYYTAVRRLRQRFEKAGLKNYL